MAPLQRARADKGFALFESLICLNVFLLLCAGALFISHILIVQIWLHAELHEALLCLKRAEAVSTCKDELQDNSRLVMRFARIADFHVIENSEERSTAEIVWVFKNQSFRVRRTVSWRDVLRKRAFSL